LRKWRNSLWAARIEINGIFGNFAETARICWGLKKLAFDFLEGRRNYCLVFLPASGRRRV
jgi:hypothetical protein